MRLSTIVPIVLLLLASSFSSYAQTMGPRVTYYRSYGSLSDARKKIEQRGTYGYHMRFSSMTFTAHYKDGTSGEPSLNRHIDTSIERKVRSDMEGTWGAFVENFAPLAHLDEQSILALHYGGYVDFFKFDLGEMALKPGQLPVNGELVGVAFGFNIGLDYRVGGDAILDKQSRTMFNIGAGLSPGFMASSYEKSSVESAGFALQPYLKAEAGFFLGIAFKVRADLLLGKGKYLDASIEGEDDRLDVTATSPIRGVRLGLGIMPFSWDWDGDY